MQKVVRDKNLNLIRDYFNIPPLEANFDIYYGNIDFYLRNDIQFRIAVNSERK